MRPPKRKHDEIDENSSPPVKNESNINNAEIKPPPSKEIKIESGENDETGDIELIPAISPDNTVIRVFVEYGKPEHFDSKLSEAEWYEAAKGRAEKLARSIESGEIDYKDLPKDQILLFDDEKDNELALYQMKVDRHLNEEKKFCLLTYDVSIIEK